jgi:nucleoside-diphosphate-sugar epimerase
MSRLATDLVRSDCAEVLKPVAQHLAPLKGETVFITGGTGFVGTWLAEALTYLNDEHRFGTQVILYSRGTERFKKSVPHLSGRKDVVLMNGDVRHLAEVPQETGWLIHAAANPNNRFHSSNPVETMAVIADGTMAALRAVERCSNFKTFLNLSSALVYGSQPIQLDRMPESYFGGMSCGTLGSVYADSKRFGETVCAAFRSQARIPVVTARPFAFIGPYQSLDTPWAINNFIADALSGNAIRVLGDGQTVRSYMYPSDLAYWLLRILTAGTNGAQYNVGSPEGVRLSDLAAMVAEKVTPRSEIRLHSAPTMNTAPSRLVPDISSAERTLGLSVTVPLAQALDRTIRWNRSRM